MRSKHNVCDILVVSPSTSGGSWISTSLVVKELLKAGAKKIIVCSFKGKGRLSGKTIQHYMLKIDISPLFGSTLMVAPLLSMLILTPLVLMSLILAIIRRPRIIITNGIIPLLPFALLKRVLFRETILILSYHGVTKGYIPRIIVGLLKVILNPNIDLAFTNSTLSKEDLSIILDPSKIVVLGHPLEEFFVEEARRPIDTKKEQLKKQAGLEDKFVVLFVGRLSYEKFVDVLLKICVYLAKTRDIAFVFIGDGPLRRTLEELAKKYENIVFPGYVSDRKALIEYYTMADVLWGYADETYLGRPVLEALACGTPVIIPNVAAIYRKRIRGVRVKENLIPPTIGWLVDPNDISGIIQLLHKLKRSRTKLKELSKLCKNYALDEAMRVKRNLSLLVQYIMGSIKQR